MLPIDFCNGAELDHQADVLRDFYSRFAGDVIVGIEASGYSPLFVGLVEGLGHEVLIGAAAEGCCIAKASVKLLHL